MTVYPFTVVYPIGLQPFIRCHYQIGYIVKDAPNYDVFSDMSFSEVKFQLSKDICEWIYQEMDGGRKIYPYESICGINDKINFIKNTKTFSQNSFEVQMDFWNKPESERKDIIKNLQ